MQTLQHGTLHEFAHPFPYLHARTTYRFLHHPPGTGQITHADDDAHIRAFRAKHGTLFSKDVSDIIIPVPNIIARAAQAAMSKTIPYSCNIRQKHSPPIANTTSPIFDRHRLAYFFLPPRTRIGMLYGLIPFFIFIVVCFLNFLPSSTCAIVLFCYAFSRPFLLCSGPGLDTWISTWAFFSFQTLFDPTLFKVSDILLFTLPFYFDFCLTFSILLSVYFHSLFTSLLVYCITAFQIYSNFHKKQQVAERFVMSYKRCLCCIHDLFV